MSKETIVTANRKHKDRLFCYIFGQEENKVHLLSLYNALNHSHYENPDDLEFTTLEDAIYMSMKNDVSFLISDYMNLFEHQSTINPNMPLRGFLYFARLYEAYLSKHRFNVYSHKRIPLPTPQYFVFYNGTADAPEKQEYRLSDSFLKKDDSHQFEWTATMLNINAEHNQELMEHCQALSEYAAFIQDVREFQNLYHDLDQAIDEAVKLAETRPCLSDFFRKNRAEVSHVVLTEFDEEAFAKTLREEGIIEGIVLSGIENQIPKEKILQQIIKQTGINEKTALEYYELYRGRM
ncbi:MAG: hypothetical protein ACI4HI_05005 [Lachnospiraceae bacterium]